jgi:hypothetical protein
MISNNVCSCKLSSVSVSTDPQVEMEDLANAAQAALQLYNVDPTDPNVCAALMKAMNALDAFVKANPGVSGASAILTKLQAETGAGGASMESLAATYGTSGEAAALNTLEHAPAGLWGTQNDGGSSLYGAIWNIDAAQNDSGNPTDQTALKALESALQAYQNAKTPAEKDAAARTVAAAMQEVDATFTAEGTSDGFLTEIQSFMKSCPTGAGSDLFTLASNISTPAGLTAFEKALDGTSGVNSGLTDLLTLINGGSSQYKGADQQEGWPV